MLTMLEDRLGAARDTPVLVTERSLYRYVLPGALLLIAPANLFPAHSAEVFLDRAGDECDLFGWEHAVLSRLLKRLRASAPKAAHVDLFVYLRTTPEVAYERVCQRWREEERERLSLDAITDLHGRFEDYFLPGSRALVRFR